MNVIKNQTGVVVVDFQADFTQVHQGSLSVEGTDPAYIEKVIDATQRLKQNGFMIFATRDFHPQNHMSFYTNNENVSPMDVIQINDSPQVMWPPHCVQGTKGSELLIDADIFNAVVEKGCDPKFDSYSGFFDDGNKATGLEKKLKDKGIETLILYGLATDYCVKATAVDAVKTGFKVLLIKDLCRGVATDTTQTALTEMENSGIRILEASDLIKHRLG